MYLAAALFLILSESISEALSDEGKKMVAGIIEFINLAVITLIIFAWLNCVYPKGIRWQPAYYWQVVAGYILLRFALFDLAYNLIRRLPLFYIGMTKLSDKLLRKFFTRTRIPAEHMLFMFKLISLVIGLTWLLK
jgi:uncharacterized membrane protein